MKKTIKILTISLCISGFLSGFINGSERYIGDFHNLNHYIKMFTIKGFENYFNFDTSEINTKAFNLVYGEGAAEQMIDNSRMMQPTPNSDYLTTGIFKHYPELNHKYCPKLKAEITTEKQLDEETEKLQRSIEEIKKYGGNVKNESLKIMRKKLELGSYYHRYYQMAYNNCKNDFSKDKCREFVTALHGVELAKEKVAHGKLDWTAYKILKFAYRSPENLELTDDDNL